MIGFCELCGRDQALEPDGRLERTPEGLYVCPRCLASVGPEAVAAAVDASTANHAAPRRRRAVLTDRASIALAVLLAIPIVATVVGSTRPSPAPGPSGAVLGATAIAPSPTAVPIGVATAPRASVDAGGGSTTVPGGSPPPRDVPSGTPARFAVGDGTALTWTGLFGETRIQVIVPVRNDGSVWLALPQSTSTYRVEDADGRELASGVFTAALPAAVAPNHTGYLVDTVSAAFLAGRGRPVVDATVRAVGIEPPTAQLSVTDLAALTAADGGLRVSGTVSNDGTTASERVVAGAVVLDDQGRPLGAVYDPGQIGRMEAGSSHEFDTAYPGAPPPAGDGATLVGVAFELPEDPTG